jgi:hypothetical protein
MVILSSCSFPGQGKKNNKNTVQIRVRSSIRKNMVQGKEAITSCWRARVKSSLP